jgi:glycerol-3-phosphate acyltransferase PlsX
MGTDTAPQAEVEGVVAAMTEGDFDVVLVGDEVRVRKAMESWRGEESLARVEVRHAPEVIGMDESPAIAVRHKKKSSMRLCFDLAKAGEVDAVVSGGNSGAMMACGLFVLGRLAGIERPAIVTTFPTKTGQCALLDMGANVDPRPHVLAQFAVMGSVFARLSHKKGRPKVGLLSNGAEEHKGTLLTRGAHELLSRAGRGAPGPAAPASTPPSVPDRATAEFDYVGYVEGNDIFEGEVDVIVTDGFTGNVLLKGLEGLADMMFEMVRGEVDRGSILEKLGAELMRPALRRFHRKTDYAETGGAPLVGVEGVVLICHGGSDARAIKNATLVARDFAHVAFRQELAQAVAAHAFLWDERETSGSAAPSSPGMSS